MIWTAWRNEATMVTPAPMPVAQRFAYEYYISYPSNLSWIPFSCSKLSAVGPSIYCVIRKVACTILRQDCVSKNKNDKVLYFLPINPSIFFVIWKKTYRWQICHLYIQYSLQVIAFGWILTSDFFSYIPWIQSKNFHYISIVCIITNNNIIQIILIQSNWVLIIY